MPRKRFVNPEFFTHGELYDAEVATGLPLRLAYAGLWTACDRRGMFWWKPREMKLHIMPYDSVDFDAILWALEAHGFVEAYVVDGKRLGRIPSFDRWQSFHKNEVPSDVPEPSNGRRESSKDGPTPSLSVAVAVTTSTAVAVTTAVTTGRETGVSRSGKPKAEAHPHFSADDCREAVRIWTSKRSATNSDKVRRSLGPVWPKPLEADRPTGVELLKALNWYCTVIGAGRSAPWASLEKAADLLVPIARLPKDMDPDRRYESVFVLVHGHQPPKAVVAA